MEGLIKILLIAVGTLCVVLGILGMFLPLLPTTPFLLLAAACYARSSEQFYHWLMTNPWFGSYIKNYREGRGIPLAQKMITILLLWLVIVFSIWFIVSHWWIRLVLFNIALGVTIHLLRMNTYRPEPGNSEKSRAYNIQQEVA